MMVLRSRPDSINLTLLSGIFLLAVSVCGCAFLAGDLTGIGVGAIAGSATQSPATGAVTGGAVGAGTGALAGYAVGGPIAGAIGGALSGTAVGYMAGRATSQK